MLRIRPSLGLTFDDVLLVPQKTAIESRSHVDISTHLTPKIKLAVPLIPSNMDTVVEAKMAIAVAQEGSLGIIHRFLTIEREAEEVKLVRKEGYKVGAAVGINTDYKERTEALVKAGANVILIDIAHGHSVHLLKVLKELVKAYPKTEFIAGNVATAEGALDLVRAGAAAVKVGIGPGSICITRLVAGAGVPQMTAIADVVEAVGSKVPVIADGGCKTSGDIVKALAAGASTVMNSSLFVGCEESPALTIFRNNRKFKFTRGMASLMANYDRQNKEGKVRKDLQTYAAEGVEGIVPYKGDVAEVIKQLMGGVRSGFSYCGAATLKELWKKAEFIQISQNALIESRPHDVDVM